MLKFDNIILAQANDLEIIRITENLLIIWLMNGWGSFKFQNVHTNVINNVL